MLTIGSLFAGIGGFDLGLERAGMRTVWQVEIDPFCRAVLAQHFPDAKRHEDVLAVGARNLPYVDVICGGFPCQDLSPAGKGAGLAGARSGLWSEYARIVGELRPRYVIVENVAALLTRGLGTVLSDLAALGYDAEWDCLPASAVGAPHKRDRLWVVSYPYSSGLERHGGERKFGSPSRTVHLGRRDWWATEPHVGRVANGVPARVDRLRSLGNALVPQIAEWIGRRIVAYEEECVNA